MRAVVIEHPGPSSGLTLLEREVPEPGPGQVRVRLHRAGVNPTDWKARADGGRPTGGGVPASPGQDGAGVVDALGEGVASLEVGDRVWVLLAQHDSPWGTAAESTVVPAEYAVRLPDTASFDLGASLGVPAVTAHRVLTSGERATRIAPGSMKGLTVMVAGGAGAVGNAAIQLAVWAGATVIATVSGEEKAALARAAGAHHVVNYRTEGVADRVAGIVPGGVDLIAEVALAENLDLDLAVVANRGTIAYYADNGGAEATLPVRASFAKNARWQGVLLYTLGADLLAVATQDVTAAVTAGALRVGADAGLPLHHFPLEETAAAHDAVEAGAIGKVLLDL